MTTEYIYKNTIEVLGKEFPELSGCLADIDGAVTDVIEFKAPVGNMLMKLFLSDRVNVRWELDGMKLGEAEGFFADEIVDVIRGVISEQKLFAIYQTDLELASKHKIEIPEGIPTRPIPQLISKEAIPESNSEYFYANKITLASWLGTMSKEFYAPYQ